MAQNAGNKNINVMPTRELFVYMLTKDIPLIPAIMDLVDNCSDRAKKLRGEKSLEGLWGRIAMQQYMLLQRNLVYTGITRGKKLVVLIGQRKALVMAVRNNRTENRFSGLLARLIEPG